MTEKEFLKLFNDIDDKFIKEEQEDIAPLYPVEIKYPAETKSNLKRFSWGSFAAAAAVCAVAVGGLFAVGHYFGGGEFWVGYTTTIPSQTVTEYTSADVTAVPETENTSVTEKNPSDISGELPRDQMPVMYETTLNCNGKSYTLTALLHRVRSDESLDGVTKLDQNYIWGDVLLELSLDGEVKDMIAVYEYCYGLGQVGGMPFDKKNLGYDYFRVLNMEQDVLAYFTPNKKLEKKDEYEGVIMNAQLFTVSDDERLVTFKGDVDEDQQNTGLVHCFKFTPAFDVRADSLTLHLSEDVNDPWADNGTIFYAGDIPLSVDFENYLIKCESVGYKYLVYYYTDPWYPPLTLMDGSIAFNSAILKYDHIAQGDFDYYSVNCCFAVPFFTSAENRAAGEEGAWFVLKKGYHIGDYYIQSAVSDYFINENAGYYPYSYQCKVDLYGDLNCTGTAEKLYNSFGEVSAIKITIDRKYCDKLFGLEPSVKVLDDKYANVFNKDFEDDRICFILTEKMSNYYKVFLSLNDKDSVRVSLVSMEFSLSYHFETGYTYDGMTLLGFDDDDYFLEILE